MMSSTQKLIQLNEAEKRYLEAKQKFSKYLCTAGRSCSDCIDGKCINMDELYKSANEAYMYYTQVAKEFVMSLTEKPNNGRK
jgi:hypothetical protein